MRRRLTRVKNSTGLKAKDAGLGDAGLQGASGGRWRRAGIEVRPWGWEAGLNRCQQVSSVPCLSLE
jgi:hypothetical protein